MSAMWWAHTQGDVVVRVFPGAAEADVRAVGDRMGETTTPVPSGTQAGATLVDGKWVAPEPAVSAAPVGPRMLSRVLFRYRFTVAEEAAVTVAAATNPALKVFLDRLLDPGLENVDLNNEQVRQGLQFLSTIDDPLRTGTPRPKILAPARVAELLA